MADESKGGIPTIAWVILALVVVWFLVQKTQKAAKAATGTLGQGIGKGVVDEIGSKASAIGSFIGGVFGSSKSSGAGKGGASAADSDDTDLKSFASTSDLAHDSFEDIYESDDE